MKTKLVQYIECKFFSVALINETFEYFVVEIHNQPTKNTVESITLIIFNVILVLNTLGLKNV